jgi:hypothetical protein
VCKEGATGAPTQPPPHHRLRLAVALAIAAASSCLPSEPPPRLRLACPLACCLPGTRCRPWRFGPFHLLLVPFSGRRLICSCLVLPVAVWLHHLLDLVVSARRASGFTISLCFYSADLFPWWFLDFGLNLLHSARFSNIFFLFFATPFESYPAVFRLRRRLTAIRCEKMSLCSCVGFCLFRFSEPRMLTSLPVSGGVSISDEQRRNRGGGRAVILSLPSH